MKRPATPFTGWIRTGVLVAGIFTLLLSEASAQDVRVGVGKGWLDHELLGAPVGAGVTLGIQLTDRLGLRAGYERYRQDFTSFGSTCVGLMPPDADCDGESRTDEARISAFTLTAPISLFTWDRVTVALVPGVRTGSVSNLQTGDRTGRRRSAEKNVIGLELGGELRTQIHPSHPFFADLRGSVGSLRRWNEENIADGYTPFEDPMGYTRLEVGLSVRR